MAEDFHYSNVAWVALIIGGVVLLLGLGGLFLLLSSWPRPQSPVSITLSRDFPDSFNPSAEWRPRRSGAV